MTPARRVPADPWLARWVHRAHPARSRAGLARQIHGGVALGAVAGAAAGLVWLAFAHGRALGGPAALGALAGLAAGGGWLWRVGGVGWPRFERSRPPTDPGPRSPVVT